MANVLILIVQTVLWSTNIDGVDSHHFELEWYKNNLIEDSHRISKLFDYVKSRNWELNKVICSLEY